MSGKLLSVSATIAHGRLKVLDADLYRRGLAQFGDGEALVLTVEEVEATRTNRQNRFFHGPVLRAFMERTGYSKEEAKTELCLALLPREHTRPDGSVVTVPGHTSSLSVKEFNAFIESCIELAARMDIQIEDADQWRQKGHAA